MLVSLLAPPQPRRVERGDVVLDDVTVVNPGRGRRPHERVEIRGGTIAAISRSGSAGPSPAHRFLVPGLIDLHVHHPGASLATDERYFGLLHLAHGVTTVRDCGSVDGSSLGLRSQVARGEFPAPRIFACGPILDGDPPFWRGAEVARGAQDAERIVDAVAASGADCVKVYSNLSADALRGARAAAARHRLPLIGHVPVGVSFEEARLDEVQHLTGFVEQTGTGETSAVAAVLAGWESIRDERIDRIVRASVELGIAHTPTLVVIDRLLRLEDPAAQWLPRCYRDVIWKPGGLPGWSVPPLDDETKRRVRRNFCAVVRKLHEAGAVLHVGSDVLNPFVVPGVALHEELRTFAACGFTPEQAFEAATRGNGEALRTPSLGVIEVGAPADVLVFREDPTRDLDALATLEAVVADGRLYTREFLDSERARYQRYFSGRLYDRLMTLAVRAGSEVGPAPDH